MIAKRPEVAKLISMIECVDDFGHVAVLGNRGHFRQVVPSEVESVVGGHSLEEAEIASQRDRVLPCL